MKIHEYQAKEILRSYGVPTPRGEVAFTPDEAKEAALLIRARRAAVLSWPFISAGSLVGVMVLRRGRRSRGLSAMRWLRRS